MTYEEVMNKLKRGEKMTYEEAIKQLNSVSIYHFDKYTADAINMAIDALEKQIPKKPLHMHKNYYCPICKENGWMLWDDAIPNDTDKYCGICGQAINWEED